MVPALTAACFSVNANGAEGLVVAAEPPGWSATVGAWGELVLERSTL